MIALARTPSSAVEEAELGLLRSRLAFRTSSAERLRCGNDLRGGFFQRLRQIGNDVVNMLDADAKANHFWRHAGLELLFGSQLPVGGGCRVARQRFGVAHVDHALKKFHRIETLHTWLEAALHSEGQQRTTIVAH